jgi:hypothetical protein
MHGVVRYMTIVRAFQYRTNSAKTGLLSNWYCGSLAFAQVFIPKGFEDISRWLSASDTTGKNAGRIPDPERIEESVTLAGSTA